MEKNLWTKWMIFSLFLMTISTKAQTYTLKFKTNHGRFEVELYDFTPKHRDLILKEIEKGTYTNAQFNRVIKNFVVQGGELDEPILAREKEHPYDAPKRLAPEFHPKAFHKLGALGAGRDENESKSSYYNQIYFVVGKKYSEFQLDEIERNKGIKFTPEQRNTYLKIGGQPRLDNDYTVFGEITKGLDKILLISREDTDQNGLPDEPIIFSIKVKKNKPKKVKSTSISAGVGFGHN